MLVQDSDADLQESIKDLIEFIRPRAHAILCMYLLCHSSYGHYNIFAVSEEAEHRKALKKEHRKQKEGTGEQEEEDESSGESDSDEESSSKVSASAISAKPARAIKTPEDYNVDTYAYLRGEYSGKKLKVQVKQCIIRDVGNRTYSEFYFKLFPLADTDWNLVTPS